MENRIRKSIFELLKDKNHFPKNEFYKKLSKDLEYEPPEIERVFNLMKDKGEVDFARGDTMLIRLTNEGIKANKSFFKKIMEYLAHHWIAIIALVVSIISLLRTS